MTNKNRAYDAVEKHSSDLVSLLSAEVVTLHDFGQALVVAKFMNQSALKNIMDIGSTNDKAWKLYFAVSTQVQHYPKKFQTYLTILEKFSSLSSLLQGIRAQYYGVWFHSCVCVPKISKQSQLCHLKSTQAMNWDRTTHQQEMQ